MARVRGEANFNPSPDRQEPVGCGSCRQQRTLVPGSLFRQLQVAQNGAGCLVPALKIGRGPLHWFSVFNPFREAQRLLSSVGFATKHTKQASCTTNLQPAACSEFQHR